MIKIICLITAFLVSFNEPIIDDIVVSESNYEVMFSEPTDISNNEIDISENENDISENEIILYSSPLTNESVESPDYSNVLLRIESLLLILVIERVLYIAWDMFNFGGRHE